MPYYIPVEQRNTYLRFKEALEDSDNPNIDEFIAGLDKQFRDWQGAEDSKEGKI